MFGNGFAIDIGRSVMNKTNRVTDSLVRKTEATLTLKKINFSFSQLSGRQAWRYEMQTTTLTDAYILV